MGAVSEFSLGLRIFTRGMSDSSWGQWGRFHRFFYGGCKISWGLWVSFHGVMSEFSRKPWVSFHNMLSLGHLVFIQLRVFMGLWVRFHWGHAQVFMRAMETWVRLHISCEWNSIEAVSFHVAMGEFSWRTWVSFSCGPWSSSHGGSELIFMAAASFMEPWVNFHWTMSSFLEGH